MEDRFLNVYDLNISNDYKNDIDIDYAVDYFEENKIFRLYEKQTYYRYDLSSINTPEGEIKSSNVYVVPELKNRMIGEKDFDTISVYFNGIEFNDFEYLSSSCLVLKRDEGFQLSIENSHYDLLTMVYIESENIISASVNDNDGKNIYKKYFMDVDKYEIASDINRIIFQSQDLDIKNLPYENDYSEPEFNAELKIGPFEEGSDESMTLNIGTSDSGKIVLDLPEYDFDHEISQEFIVRIKISDPLNRMIPVVFTKDTTIENGRLNTIFIRTNETSTILFRQLRNVENHPHYIVQELNENFSDEKLRHLYELIMDEKNNRISVDDILSS